MRIGSCVLLFTQWFDLARELTRLAADIAVTAAMHDKYEAATHLEIRLITVHHTFSARCSLIASRSHRSDAQSDTKLDPVSEPFSLVRDRSSRVRVGLGIHADCARALHASFQQSDSRVVSYGMRLMVCCNHHLHGQGLPTGPRSAPRTAGRRINSGAHQAPTLQLPALWKHDKRLLKRVCRRVLHAGRELCASLAFHAGALRHAFGVHVGTSSRVRLPAGRGRGRTSLMPRVWSLIMRWLGPEITARVGLAWVSDRSRGDKHAA